MFSDYRLLPEYLSSTRGVLNPENQDNKSFGYAIVFHFHPGDWVYNTPEDLEHWILRFKQHGLDKVNYPVRLTDVEKLEEQLRLRINVFTFDDPEGFKRHHYYISPKYYKEEVNLLYWDQRFVYIRHFSRLFSDISR